MDLIDLKPGMIGLSGGNTFTQRAIRFFTKSTFSHSFPFLDGPYNIISSIETTSTIITINPIQNKIKEPDYIQVWEVFASDEEKQKALKETYLEYSETWYGYLSYLWFMYRWVCRLFKYEPIEVWSWAATGVTCTELTCYYLIKLNKDFADLFIGKDYSAQSPQELVDIMQQNPNLFKFKGWIKK